MKRRIAILIGIAVALLLVAWLWPLPAALTGRGLPESTKILDRNGQELYEVRNGGSKSEIPLSRIPQSAVDALIATEDRTFETNPGISLRGISRAFLHDLDAGSIVEGGSTITQQLVRTMLQPRSRGFVYKLHEAWLALKLNASSTKDEILERFLNDAYFGQQAYGISAAARTYFDTTPDHLSLGQSALLVGLLNAPTSLNPFKDLKGATERRDLVLRAMRATHAISDDDFDEALSEPVALSHGKVPIRAPHFVLWVLQQHPEIAGHGDIKTTLDLDLQTATEAIVDRQIDQLAEKNVTSAAVVVLDAHTGDILSMVGSRDYFDEEHDGAVNVAVSARQPGSAMKPFTYALALSQGMTAASTVADVEAQFFTQDGNPYVPRNYDYQYHGLVRLREALANSYNIAAVKVLQKVGVERLLTFLKSVGISTLTEAPEHYGLALTLGDSEVKLLDLVSAYGIFPRHGQTLAPKALLDEAGGSDHAALDPKVAWLITDILSDNDARSAEFGRESALAFNFPVAAKTGTTRNSRDNWTIGYTPDRIVGVWVGNADNSPMKGTSGVTGAGPIFHDVMVEATKNLQPQAFTRPSGTVDLDVCRLSGKLPTELCPDIVKEHFIAGTQPTDKDDIYVKIPIDARNGLRAGPACPPQFVTEKVFTDFPSEVKKWAREKGWPEPPAQYSPFCPKTAQTASGSFISITSPDIGASFLLDPLIPDEYEQIVLEARASSDIQSVDWLVDGVKVGEGTAPDFHVKWQPTVGTHRIEAVKNTARDHVSIDVQKS